MKQRKKSSQPKKKFTKKKDLGKDISQAVISLDNAKALLETAKAAYDEGNYEEAVKFAKEAKHLAMWSKGKDIKSTSEKSKFGQELGECIGEANQEAKESGEEKDFSHCFDTFQEEVQNHVLNTLETKNKNANKVITKKLEQFAEKAGKELEKTLSDFEDFNLSGIDEDETLEDLEEILESDLDESEQEEAIVEKLKEIKDKSTEDKYNKGVVPFKDTDDQDWFFYFVDLMSEENCITGFTDSKGNPIGEFKPGKKVIFGESLKFVMECVLDEEPNETESGAYWAKGYSLKALDDYSDFLSEGIMDHISKSIENKEEFKKELSRGELIQLVVDLLGIDVPEATESPFSDVSLDHPNVDAIAYALENGLISGDADDLTFRPDDAPNRAEVAKIMLLAKELL